MQPLLPQVSAALFSSEDAARDKIRQAMREAPHWREGRVYQCTDRPRFLAELTASAALPTLSEEFFVLVERHDRAGWLGAEEAADV